VHQKIAWPLLKKERSSMILTKEILLEKIKKKEIKIEPFDKSSIGPASIDLTLDKKIRIFKNDRTHLIIKETEGMAVKISKVFMERDLYPKSL